MKYREDIKEFAEDSEIIIGGAECQKRQGYLIQCRRDYSFTVVKGEKKKKEGSYFSSPLYEQTLKAYQMHVQKRIHKLNCNKQYKFLKIK